MTGDMSATIIPRSDQTNADDLIVGPMTIKIVGVYIKAGDQPVSIDYEGGEGRPFKPCKSMRRILVEAWGADSAAYVGRSMTLVRDPTVRFGKDEVGGIRISHLSHIDRPMRVALTITKGKRAPYSVEPLVTTGGLQKPTKKQATPEEKQAAAREKAMTILAELAKTKDVEGTMKKHADMIVRLGTVDASIPVDIRNAMSARAKELSETDPPRFEDPRIANGVDGGDVGEDAVRHPPSQPALIDDDADKR